MVLWHCSGHIVLALHPAALDRATWESQLLLGNEDKGSYGQNGREQTNGWILDCKNKIGQHKTSSSSPMSLLSKLWRAACLIRYEEKAEARLICPCKLSIIPTEKKRKKMGLPFCVEDSGSAGTVWQNLCLAQRGSKGCRASKESRGWTGLGFWSFSDKGKEARI